MPSGGEGGTASVKLGLMVEKAGSARLATLYRDRKPTKRDVGFPFFLLFYLVQDANSRNSTGHIQGESPLLGLLGKRLTGTVRGFSPGWLLPMKSNLRTP